MEKFPKDIEKLVYSFLFKCKMCHNHFNYPLYTKCASCAKFYKEICLNCYKTMTKESKHLKDCFSLLKLTN